MNKKAFEMTITTVVVLVIALILLSVGIYIIYTKILKPAETTGSFITCEARGGEVASGPGCPNTQPCSICIKLPTETSKENQYCCIKELT